MKKTLITEIEDRKTEVTVWVDLNARVERRPGGRVEHRVTITSGPLQGVRYIESLSELALIEQEVIAPKSDDTGLKNELEKLGYK